MSTFDKLTLWFELSFYTFSLQIGKKSNQVESTTDTNLSFSSTVEVGSFRGPCYFVYKIYFFFFVLAFLNYETKSKLKGPVRSVTVFYTNEN